MCYKNSYKAYSKGGVDIKSWLKDIREEKNLSQEAISKAANIAQASYSNIENGKRDPSVPVAKRIAAVLGFDWTRFYDESDKTQDST